MYEKHSYNIHICVDFLGISNTRTYTHMYNTKVPLHAFHSCLKGAYFIRTTKNNAVVSSTRLLFLSFVLVLTNYIYMYIIVHMWHSFIHSFSHAVICGRPTHNCSSCSSCSCCCCCLKCVGKKCALK